MFTPERMEQLHVLFYRQDVESVADAVVRHGAMQLVDTADIEDWAENLPRAGTGDESVPFRERQDMVESIFHLLSEHPDLTHANTDEMTWNDLDHQLKQLNTELKGLIESQEDTGRELNRLRELKKYLDESVHVGFALENKDSHSYLAVEAGRIADENLSILNQSLQSVLHVMSPVQKFGGTTVVLIVSLRRDRDKIQRALREAGSKPVETQKEAETLTPDAIHGLETRIHDTQTRFDELTLKKRTWTKEHIQFFNRALYQIKREVLKQKILRYFRKTEQTFLISGWIPMTEQDTFITEIRKATKNRCIIEKSDADAMESVIKGKVDVPVKMKNLKPFKPFELITGAYGIPAYRTIDPTPILGLSFMLMFGMMFGDLGHGLVLVLLGLVFFLKGNRDIYKNAGILMIYVGGASMLFGLLFGSFFGFEHLSWLPTVWVKPMESISTLFKVAIYFGIGMIFIAIVLNIINAIRQRKFLNAIFDKAGLLAAILYWCGIAVASRVISSNPEVRGEMPLFILLPMIISVFLLFLKEPILHMAEDKKNIFPEGVTTGIMGGLVEVLEIILGFLANTVSFIRVAAFGLAHAGLFMAIFSLSDSVGGVGSVFVMFFGNILIILLEGLVVSIQAVRLEFYEFFSRFFQQGKTAYRPLRSELLED